MELTMELTEAKVAELAELFKRRRAASEAQDYAETATAFREAAEKQFGGTGSNASIRNAVGGIDALAEVLRTAVLSHLHGLIVDTDEEIRKAGARP